MSILVVTKNIMLNPFSDLSFTISLALRLTKFLFVARGIFFFGTIKPKNNLLLLFFCSRILNGPEDSWCSFDLKMES